MKSGSFGLDDSVGCCAVFLPQLPPLTLLSGFLFDPNHKWLPRYTSEKGKITFFCGQNSNTKIVCFIVCFTGQRE